MGGARRSMGGRVVEESLSILGYDLGHSRIAMVETARPKIRYSRVLVQSAWNVLPWDEFRQRQLKYPPSMQRRAIARRMLAHWNMRRADAVVCLSRSVGALLYNSLGITPIVAPVSASLPDWDSPIDWNVPVRPNEFLVPGTVTWFKRPELALEIALAETNDPKRTKVIYCGRDDGSGAWPSVVQRALDLGIGVDRRVVARSELWNLYNQSEATILPSSLESLGFALSEALLYAPRVIASPIPPHVEVSERLGIEPEWLEDVPGPGRGRGTARRPHDAGGHSGTDRQRVEQEWHGVARALTL